MVTVLHMLCCKLWLQAQDFAVGGCADVALHFGQSVHIQGHQAQ